MTATPRQFDDPPAPQQHQGMLLVTAIEVGQGTGCTAGEQLEALLLRRAGEGDGVFRPEFLEGLVLVRRGPAAGDGLVDEARELLAGVTKGNRWVRVASLPGASVRPGVYVLVGSRLRPAYRVYDDCQRAFSTGLKPRAAVGCGYVCPRYIYTCFAPRGTHS